MKERGLLRPVQKWPGLDVHRRKPRLRLGQRQVEPCQQPLPPCLDPGDQPQGQLPPVFQQLILAYFRFRVEQGQLARKIFPECRAQGQLVADG